MRITFDPWKREATSTRGLDFATDARKVFTNENATWQDDRFDYGEPRFITAGTLDNRLVVMVWTPRGAARHIISMRYGHAKEARKIAARAEREKD